MPDGKQLVTSSNDRTVNFWDLDSGKIIRTIDGYQGAVIGVAVSPDGKWLATTSGDDDPVKLWNLQQINQPAHTFDTRDGFVPHVAFSPDSRYLVVPSWSGAVFVFDVASGDEILHFTNVGGVNCAAFSPDGKNLALATNGNLVELIAFNRTPSDQERLQISTLIEQLDDDDYAKREHASRRLADLGIVALTQLQAAVDSLSPEVRVRCRRLVQRLQDAEFALKLDGHKAEAELGGLFARQQSAGQRRLARDGEVVGCCRGQRNLHSPARVT